MIGCFVGIIHDLQTFRKAQNIAKRDNLPPPEFDFYCTIMHALMGLSAGFGGIAALDAVKHS